MSDPPCTSDEPATPPPEGRRTQHRLDTRTAEAIRVGHSEPAGAGEGRELNVGGWLLHPSRDPPCVFTLLPSRQRLPMPLSDDVLRRAVARLRDALPDLILVYLFGSAVHGEQTAESDVDLAVLLADGREVDPEQRWSLQGELADVFRRDVDVVDLRAASVVMRAQVVRTGRVVFARDETDRYRFEVTALTMYADLNVQRRAILNDIQDRGRVHDG